jgi:CheY-like chemotaxis protein
MREYVTRLLRRQWAVGGRVRRSEALARAHERPPDSILADVMMPGLDGFGLLRALRDDQRTRAFR